MKKFALVVSAGIAMVAFSASAAEGVTWRGSVSYEEIVGQTDPYAAVDVMAEFGVNLMTSLPRYEVPPKKAAEIKKLLAYMRTKGIRAVYMPTTAVYDRTWVPPPNGVTPQTWPCVGLFYPWKDNYYCWADDAAIEHSAERYADFLEYVGAEDAYIILHPVDTGDDGNPENWTRRCAKCRARWGDDERWKASANLCNIWSRVIRRRCPNAMIGSCIYPYTLGLLQVPESRRDDVFRRDVVEYFRKMDDAVEDRQFSFQSWIFPAHVKKEVCDLVRNRPIMQFDTFPHDVGIFATYGRHIGPSAVTGPGREPSAFVPYTRPWPIPWETYFLTAAYAQDPQLPGTEPFDGVTYYDPMGDHTGPSACIAEVLRPICRRFWGEELAPDMEKFLVSGVLPGYIQDTTDTLYWWNRVYRMPLFDANRDYTQPQKRFDKQVFKDTTERMRDQAERAETACQAIRRAAEKAKGVSLGRVQRDSLAFRLLSAPYWLAAARTKFNLKAFDDAFNLGKLDEAARLLEKARAEFDADFTAAEKGGAISAKSWRLDRKAMQPALDRAVASMRLAGLPKDDEVLSRRKREWTMPDLPNAMTTKRNRKVWSGVVVVDRPTVVPNCELVIEPGSKVEFRGNGRLDFKQGRLIASHVDFTADSVLTNAYRISLERGCLECVSCSFADLRCVFDKSVQIWAPGCISVSDSPGGSAEPRSRVEGCRFSNCSSVGFWPIRSGVFRNNRAVGGDAAITICGPSDGAVVEDNWFGGQSVGAVQVFGGSDVLVANNVFKGDAAGYGVGGGEPPKGLRVLNNDFIGLKKPVSFTRLPVSSVVVCGNVFEGCGPVMAKESAERPVVKCNNLVR